MIFAFDKNIIADVVIIASPIPINAWIEVILIKILLILIVPERAIKIEHEIEAKTTEDHDPINKDSFGLLNSLFKRLLINIKLQGAMIAIQNILPPRARIPPSAKNSA